MKTKPADRSISPQISRNTSPIAMMMIGAAVSDSRLARFVWLTNVELYLMPK